MFKITRRIIAGLNNNKASDIISDEEIESFIPYESLPSFQIQDLFYTEDKQSLETRHLNNIYNIALPEGAFRFMKIRMPTKNEMTRDLKSSGQEIPQDWYSYNIHSTDSVDYIYILSGQITCVVNKKHINLKPGDFLVQVCAEHTWVNDNDEPCYLLCIMLGTKPGQNRKDMIIK